MRRLFLGLILLLLLFPGGVHAEIYPTIPAEVRQATVRVACDNRQGSGTIISQDGFVLTNAHVVADIGATSPKPAIECRIGVIDPTSNVVRYTYRARVDRWVVNHANNQDFAILRITTPISHEEIFGPFPFLKVWEFSEENDRMWTLGFPGGTDFTVASGFIQGFGNGFIRTTATFRPGNSGGTAINGAWNLIGVPTRIVTITEDGKAQRIRYELIDIRAVLQWLDAISPTERDRYFTFADPTRSRASATFVAQSSLECDYVVRTRQGSTVFCLLPGDERLAFPNAATFFSWYPTFDTVETVPDEALRDFALKRNVTFRPGTLVKSQTFPEVYLVTDVFGTMRHVPSEARAIELWGPNWASLVRDVADEFFSNYTIGPELNNI